MPDLPEALSVFRVAGMFLGLRPGEKLYEELILEGSEERTVHEDVFVATPQTIDRVAMIKKIDQLLDSAQQGRESECLRILMQLASHSDTAQDSAIARSIGGICALPQPSIAL